MIHVADVPDDAQLESFYRAYTGFKTGIPTGPRAWFRAAPFKPPHPYIEILKRTGGLRARRLCEVGCYHGSFLRRASDEGAVVLGIELDDAALAALVRQRLPAARAIEPGSTFDIVCAFQVIEHLADPGQWIRTVASALEPGGRLLLAMPNGGEAGRVGPGWLGYRVDLEHLNYFDLGSLARLLERANLYVEQFWESGQPILSTGISAGGPLHWLADLGARLVARPSFDDGTFVLSVLARKPDGAAPEAVPPTARS